MAHNLDIALMDYLLVYVVALSDKVFRTFSRIMRLDGLGQMDVVAPPQIIYSNHSLPMATDMCEDMSGNVLHTCCYFDRPDIMSLMDGCDGPQTV